jgi:Domain of unknown function (DUF4082)
VNTRSFLRFTTNGSVPTGATVTGAKLKLYVTNNAVSTGGFEVHSEPDTWTESGTTWTNQPTWNSTVIATSSTPTTGSWLTIDLPASAVSTSGNTSLGLKYTVTGANTQFNSREDSTHKPELSISYSPFTTNSDSHYVSPVLTFGDSTAPAVPANVTPSVGPNSVTLNWDQALDTHGDNVTPAKSYTIYRGDTQIGTAGSDITTYNDNGLSSGSYTYKVKATDYCGNTSDYSDAQTATLTDQMLFTTDSAPSASTSTSTADVTVGVKFTSDVTGEVRGVRFYRAEPMGEGASIGVWGPSGTLLGSGEVTDTDSTGWITTLLQDPVKIIADTTYTVGYYTTEGKYSYTTMGLYTPLTNGNLTPVFHDAF